MHVFDPNRNFRAQKRARRERLAHEKQDFYAAIKEASRASRIPTLDTFKVSTKKATS